MAFLTFLEEFIFFTSTFVPNFSTPLSRTEILASHLKLPSSIFPSQMSKYLTSFLTSFRYWYASSEDLISGSETISTKGTPALLRSTKL